MITALTSGGGSALSNNGGVYTAASSAVSSLNSIFLAINNNWYEVPPALYMQGVSPTMMIAASADNTWVLGLPFLANFYSIWDHAGGKAG